MWNWGFGTDSQWFLIEHVWSYSPASTEDYQRTVDMKAIFGSTVSMFRRTFFTAIYHVRFMWTHKKNVSQVLTLGINLEIKAGSLFALFLRNVKPNLLFFSSISSRWKSKHHCACNLFPGFINLVFLSNKVISKIQFTFIYNLAHESGHNYARWMPWLGGKVQWRCLRLINPKIDSFADFFFHFLAIKISMDWLTEIILIQYLY